MNLVDFVKNRKGKDGAKASLRGLEFLSGDSLLQKELKEQHDRESKSSTKNSMKNSTKASGEPPPEGILPFESSILTNTLGEDNLEDEFRLSQRLTAAERSALRHARDRRSEMALINGSIVFHKKHPQGHFAMAKAKAQRLSQAHRQFVEMIDDNHSAGEVDGDGVKENEYGVLSSLPPNTVKWMNARKKTTGPLAPYYKYHSTLASALPFKPVFKGLDTADDGDIKLTDIEDVIQKLSQGKPGEPKLFDNPREILDFFLQMDTDGGGTVDFCEFAIGMTNCPGGKGADGVVRLQEAFMKYSSDIQRAAILKRANNPHIAGLDRYHALKKLFEVPMASSSEMSGVTDDDVTKYHYKKFNETSKMVREEIHRSRQREQQRSRSAKVFFEYEKKGCLFGPLSVNSTKATDNMTWDSNTVGAEVAGMPSGVTRTRPRTEPSSLLISGSLQQLPLVSGEAAAYLASKEHTGERDQQRQLTATGSSSHHHNHRATAPTLSGGHLRPASSPTYNSIPNATLASTRPTSSPQHTTRPYSSSQRPPPGTTRPTSHSSRGGGGVTRKGPVSDPVLEDMRDHDELLRKITKSLSSRLQTLPLADKHRADQAALPPLSGALGSLSHNPPTYDHVRNTARRDAKRATSASQSFLPPPQSSQARSTIAHTARQGNTARTGGSTLSSVSNATMT